MHSVSDGGLFRQREESKLAKATGKEGLPPERLDVIGKVTEDELRIMMHSRDTVLTVVKWILYDISYHAVMGKLLVEPPVLTRVYQECSDGILNFMMANKIAQVPFPFPFAQVIYYALFLFYFFCPFIVLE